MRVWDIHPGYLSRQSLLGEHSEIHALYIIITKNKKGFSRHPETQRWRNNLNRLVLRHNLLVKEIIIRGFSHYSPLSFREINKKEQQFTPFLYLDLPSVQLEILHQKYQAKGQRGRIPIPFMELNFGLIINIPLWPEAINITKRCKVLLIIGQIYLLIRIIV